jgi:hypothetical protein
MFNKIKLQNYSVLITTTLTHNSRKALQCRVALLISSHGLYQKKENSMETTG